MHVLVLTVEYISTSFVANTTNNTHLHVHCDLISWVIAFCVTPIERRETVQQNKSGQVDLFRNVEILNVGHTDLFLRWSFKSFTSGNVQRRMKDDITVFRCGYP